MDRARRRLEREHTMPQNKVPMTAAESTAATLGSQDVASTGSQRYLPDAWDLTELMESSDEAVVERAIRRIEEAVETLEGLRDTLSPGMGRAAFLEALRHYESLVDSIDVFTSYSNLWFSSDTQDAKAIGFRNRTSELISQLHNRFLFFTLWWQSLEDDEAEALIPPADEEPDFHHFVTELRRFKPYTLDERSEQLINTKDSNGIGGILTLYSMLTNRLEFHPTIHGEPQTMTDGEIRSLFYAPEPEVRQEAYQELFRVYEKDAPILAQIYSNRVRDWQNEYVGLRGMKSAISVRNLWNDVPDAAIETLLDVVHQNAPLFQRYFRMKGQWLGLPTLRRYDLYAPLATSSHLIDYSDAVDNVLETFRGFDPHFAHLAERVFRERHIDSEIRKGKRGGAFCATVAPRFTPWVLINYAGRVRDVSTLAHELGHAIHSMMAEHHSSLTQHASLTLAETASVFSEMLMTDRLLAQETNPVTRRELLASAVDDVYATVMRQAYFVRFELAAHRAVLDNKSAEELFDLYLQHMHEQFGDSLEISEEFRYEWVSIPHLFNTPFYCYAYSFGQLLVLALYRRYQQQGDAFKPGYMKLLSYGGAVRPEVALRELDIDITDPAFWEGGFDVVRNMIDELEALETP